MVACYHPHCNATTSDAPTQCTMNGMTFIRPREAILFYCKSFGSSARVSSNTSDWYPSTVKTRYKRGLCVVGGPKGVALFLHIIYCLKGASAKLYRISSSVPITRIGQKSKRECLVVLFFTFRPWWRSTNIYIGR